MTVLPVYDRQAAEIKRLKRENETLRELLRTSRCPVDARYTAAECQQCGCTVGLFVQNEARGTWMGK